MATESAQQWWDALSAGAPADLQGLWFGLVEFEDDGWHLYAAGTAGFDADDETAEWAVGPYAWWPEGRYFPFPEAATTTAEGALEAAAAFIRALQPWASVPVRGVATGFDDGDFLVIDVD